MKQKYCSGCKETKGVDRFGKRTAGKDGLQSWCRTCKSAHHLRYIRTAPGARSRKRYRDSPKGRRAARRYRRTSSYREYQRAWRSTEAGKASALRYFSSDKGKATVKRCRSAYNALHPEVAAAAAVVARAVRAGEIPHISTRACEDCGLQARDHHHDDYDRPLDVTPLCRICHKAVHARMAARPPACVMVGDTVVAITRRIGRMRAYLITNASRVRLFRLDLNYMSGEGGDHPWKMYSWV